MSKAKKIGKPKANRGNQLKRINLIKQNEQLLSRLNKANSGE